MAIEFDSSSAKFAEYAEPGRLVTTEWLAANLDNPFRDWADSDPRAATAACKAYADALLSLIHI